jgi:hypothetical protein
VAIIEGRLRIEARPLEGLEEVVAAAAVDDADDPLVEPDPVDDERDERAVGLVGPIEERAGMALIAQVVAAETRQGMAERDGDDPFLRNCHTTVAPIVRR